MNYDEAITEARKFAARSRHHRRLAADAVNPKSEGHLLLSESTRYLALRFSRIAGRIKGQELRKRRMAKASENCGKIIEAIVQRYIEAAYLRVRPLFLQIKETDGNGYARFRWVGEDADCPAPWTYLIAEGIRDITASALREKLDHLLRRCPILSVNQDEPIPADDVLVEIPKR